MWKLYRSSIELVPRLRPGRTCLRTCQKASTDSLCSTSSSPTTTTSTFLKLSLLVGPLTPLLWKEEWFMLQHYASTLIFLAKIFYKMIMEITCKCMENIDASCQGTFQEIVRLECQGLLFVFQIGCTFTLTQMNEKDVIKDLSKWMNRWSSVKMDSSTIINKTIIINSYNLVAYWWTLFLF